MSEHDSWENDSLDEELTEAEYAELRRTTRAQDRAILLKCALREYDEKCMSRIKSILRNMYQNGVNLSLVDKYCMKNIEERRNYEIIADNISMIQRHTNKTNATSTATATALAFTTARGVQRKKIKTKKRVKRGSRKRQMKSRRR